MTAISTIVEGDGEVVAMPLLLRRLCGWLSPNIGVTVLQPIRVRRDRFLNRPEEFQRMMLLASKKAGEGGWILVLLDADDDCPLKLGAEIVQRAKAIVPYQRVSVVLANREFEAWFLASCESLNGYRGFVFDDDLRPDAEKVRGAKEWLSARMADKRYRETTDQPAFSALMDLEQAHQYSRSFRKLCSEWLRNVATA